MNMRPYEYTVIKYVHDPVAHECLNIGVLVLSVNDDRVFFDGRFEQRYGRLSEAFSGFNGENFRRSVSRLQRQVDRLSTHLQQTQLFTAEPPSLGELIKELIPDPGMSFRNGEVNGGITDDSAEELGRLFHRFISSQYEQKQGSNRSDEVVWNTFKNPLKAHHVLDKLVEKTFIADEFEYTFNHAFKNGKWHVLESASFDYVDAESLKRKATNYLGIGTALARNPEIGKMYLLLGKPSREAYLEKYERAKRFLSENLQIDHELFEEDDAEALASRVARFMEDHPEE